MQFGRSGRGDSAWRSSGRSARTAGAAARKPVYVTIIAKPYSGLTDGSQVTITGRNWLHTKHVTVEQCYDDGTKNAATTNCDPTTQARVTPAGADGTFTAAYVVRDALTTPDGAFTCSSTTGPYTNCIIVAVAPHYSPASDPVKFTVLQNPDAETPQSHGMPGKAEY